MSDSLSATRVLALSGGVGGAKLALGLSRCLAPEQLAIVCNTGDDFDHYGLRICPDLDTVMYTLAGRNDQQQGWGLANESWRVMTALAELGGESWFRLGDLDIATHLRRGALLRDGLSLSTTTRQLCERFGIAQRIVPMSDDPVATMVATDSGELSFQHYFVRDQCRPVVRGFRFRGIEQARPQQQFFDLLGSSELAAIVLCPSNPFVSIDPILELAGVREALRDSVAPVVAISPIVGGAAIKGPAAKMLRELQLPISATAVAEHYRDILDGFVLDRVDADQSDAIAGLDMAVHVTGTVMHSFEDRVRLASETLRFAGQLANAS